MAAADQARRDALKALHEMRPGPGAAQAAVRIGGQIALTAWAVSAFAGGRWTTYVIASVLGGVWLAGMLTLTHDALHRRLTGIAWIDVALARVMAWPIAWPIGVYTVVHLRHHRWAGASLRDPERIQPTQAEYQAAASWRRWYFRNQIWFSVLIAGGVGLMLRLVREALDHRQDLPGLGRAAVTDAAGITVVTLAWATAAYVSGGTWLLLGCAGIWLAAERAVGLTHQLRNHAEHYGLWGAKDSPLLTQYGNARDIETNRFAGWFFNHLNRHATHHALMGVPFYNLERAHTFLRADFARQHVVLSTARGYLAEVIDAHRAARRGAFIEHPEGPAR